MSKESVRNKKMLDPLVAAAMQARPPDPIAQQNAAMSQATLVLTAAKFILENAAMFPLEAQQHAQNFVLRCMSLDNLRVAQAPQNGEAPKP